MAGRGPGALGVVVDLVVHEGEAHESYLWSRGKWGGVGVVG
jgi:hypothetical protein